MGGSNYTNWIPLVILFLLSQFVIPFAGLATGRMTNQQTQQPNIIIIFADDLGYGDLGVYGNNAIKTPNIDGMASEGMMFTDFYVAASVCTPSRAALLTGSYPKRVGLADGYLPSEVDESDMSRLPYGVLFPFSDYGLNPDEITIAEMLKEQGYSTGHIGKWHLGHHPKFLPTRQGFDYYFGIPYSNDMAQNDYSGLKEGFISGPLPLYRNEKIIEVDPNQNYLTGRYTSETIDFITIHKDEPFFIYLAHTMPHLPIAPSRHFEGQSEYGLYGDVIEEIDWSVGQILQHLKKLRLYENTIVMFTSDNGAQTWQGEGGWVWTEDWGGRNTRREFNYKSGTNSPLRGEKHTTWEGGMRVPFVIQWPANIPAGMVAGQLTTTMDLLPTIATITGARIPDDRKIDGHNIWPILSGDTNTSSPYDAFYYYRYERLQAVRSGKWKLHLFRPGEGNTQLLYNLEDDIGETTDVSAQNPDVVKRLQELAEKGRNDLGDSVFNMGGDNRPIGILE